MFRFNNRHQGAYCCALLKLYLLKWLVKNVVTNQFGRVTAYLSSQCVQCTVQSETVHCALYTLQ